LFGNVTGINCFDQAAIVCFVVFPELLSFESCTVFVVEEIHSPALVQVAQNAIRVVP
jgi:hypothetical protein